MAFNHLRSHHGLAKRFGIDEAECRSLIDAIDKRRLILATVPTIVGLIVYWAGVELYGRGTDALEGTQWDILPLLRDLGFIGFILRFVLGLGVPVFLGLISGVALRRFLLRKQFRYHLSTPACFWCGYLLKGLERDGRSIQCPECGRRSRVGR